MTIAAGAATSLAVSSSTATINIPKPSGAAAGNIIVACLTTTQSMTITNTGYTTLLTQDASTGVRMRVAYRILDGTEGSFVTFTTSSSSNATAGSAILITGNATVSPIRASSGSGSAQATSKASPSLAGTQATDMVVIFGGVRPESSSTTNAVTGPSTGGWTAPAGGRSGPSNNTFGFPAASAVAYQINGTTGTFTCNVASGFATAAVSIIAATVTTPDSVGVLMI